MSAEMSAWFHRTLSPSHLLSGEIILGGTCLLDEFISAAVGQDGDREVTFVSPFLDEASIREIGERFGAAAPQTALRLLTTPTSRNTKTMRALDDFGWRMWDAWGCRELHAKIYTALPSDGSPVVLIGSHNLTAAGRRSNHEAGVLIHGRTSDTRMIVEGVTDYIRSLISRSVLLHDSTRPILEASPTT